MNKLFIVLILLVCVIQAKAAGSWQQSVRTRLYEVNALEPENIDTTDELISLVYDHEEAQLLGEVADMWGDHVVSKPVWREKLARSEKLYSVLVEHLDLVFSGTNYMCGSQWESNVCLAAYDSVQARSPNLMALYRQLMIARSANQYLQSVPPGAQAKSDFVREAVRSTLNGFLNLHPTTDEIRKLALWMHDFDLLFYIQDRAVRKITSASEFLKITDYYYLPPSESYRARVSTFLRSRIKEFKALRPTADELVIFQRRITSNGADQSVAVASLNEAQDAGQFLRAAQAAVDSSKGASLGQAQQLLAQNASRFSELEPTVDQINAYRNLMQNSRADLQLLRYSLPKAVSANDYLKLVRYFGDVRVRRTDFYSEGLRQVMLENLDEFMLLSPTADEINLFREKLMDPTGDLILLRAGLDHVRTSREFLLLATHFGNEPTSATTAFDFVATQALVEHLDKFISLRPSIAEIGYFRARLANPQADLKIVDYALNLASTKSQMIELVSRHASVNTKEFNRDWSNLVKKYFDKFAKLKPSMGEYGSFLTAITDDQVSAELRSRINH
jgi:hypothetical protein